MSKDEEFIAKRLLKPKRKRWKFPKFKLWHFLVFAAIAPIPIWWLYLAWPWESFGKLLPAMVVGLCVISFCVGGLAHEYAWRVAIAMTCVSLAIIATTAAIWVGTGDWPVALVRWFAGPALCVAAANMSGCLVGCTE